MVIRLEIDRCWRCGSCGHVMCYSHAEIVEYDEPSECNECFRERLEEIDLVEGLEALSDKALLDLRAAQRALKDAKSLFAKYEAAAKHARKTET